MWRTGELLVRGVMKVNGCKKLGRGREGWHAGKRERARRLQGLFAVCGELWAATLSGPQLAYVLYGASWPQGANRTVGIYPETKHPTWHDSLPIVKAAQTTMSDIVLNVSTGRGD